MVCMLADGGPSPTLVAWLRRIEMRKSSSGEAAGRRSLFYYVSVTTEPVRSFPDCRQVQSGPRWDDVVISSPDRANAGSACTTVTRRFRCHPPVIDRIAWVSSFRHTTRSGSQAFGWL